jgi:hypothetical protein
MSKEITIIFQTSQIVLYAKWKKKMNPLTTPCAKGSEKNNS